MTVFLASIIVGLACVLAGLALLAPGLFLIALGLCVLGLFGLRTVALYLWYGPLFDALSDDDETSVVHENS